MHWYFVNKTALCITRLAFATAIELSVTLFFHHSITLAQSKAVIVTFGEAPTSLL